MRGQLDSGNLTGTRGCSTAPGRTGRPHLVAGAAHETTAMAKALLDVLDGFARSG